MSSRLDGSIPRRKSSYFDAYFSFIVSGCVGLVQYWLKTGMKETPQQLARLTEQVIRKGIGVLDTDPLRI